MLFEDMPLDLVRELEGVIDALDHAGVGYALCGGLALAVHGLPRATLDIDVLVPPDAIATALRAVATIGFDVPGTKTTFGRRTDAPREITRVSKIDPDTGALLALDVIAAGGALASIWATRIEVSAGDRRIVVVSRAGLIAMKRLAARPQDLADIARLEDGDAEDGDAEDGDAAP